MPRTRTLGLWMSDCRFQRGQVLLLGVSLQRLFCFGLTMLDLYVPNILIPFPGKEGFTIIHLFWRETTGSVNTEHTWGILPECDMEVDKCLAFGVGLSRAQAIHFQDSFRRVAMFGVARRGVCVTTALHPSPAARSRGENAWSHPQPSPASETRSPVTPVGRVNKHRFTRDTVRYLRNRITTETPSCRIGACTGASPFKILKQMGSQLSTDLSDQAATHPNSEANTTGCCPSPGYHIGRCFFASLQDQSPTQKHLT